MFTYRVLDVNKNEFLDSQTTTIHPDGEIFSEDELQTQPLQVQPNLGYHNEALATYHVGDAFSIKFAISPGYMTDPNFTAMDNFLKQIFGQTPEEYDEVVIQVDSSRKTTGSVILYIVLKQKGVLLTNSSLQSIIDLGAVPEQDLAEPLILGIATAEPLLFAQKFPSFDLAYNCTSPLWVPVTKTEEPYMVPQKNAN